ncbi:hypothetical protein [Actinomadura bangladeshensis]|uniref:Uncharacterized protein n=1 Tax=Actinomadura bangladeshensis TaxID=453573 RepID=A0A4V2XMN4_9ACTN|nr:hypothetical protein [Actinomadura bangladeshensis]TDC15016.1 hypothetical protein E1284_16500 [Actinomadura bangladeshensis]
MSEPPGARKPRKIFVWDVRSRDAGWAGVTDDRGTAMQHVHRLLRNGGPDGRGSVRRVALDPLGRVRYIHLRTVAEAWRDEGTGAVVWRDG